MERLEVELPIQNMRLVAISEIFVAQTGSMCYDNPVKIGLVKEWKDWKLKTGASRDMFYQLLQRTDREMLSPWQREMLAFMQAGLERQFRK